ncbi:hypothetical protein RCH23_000757 [Cryobacterium sp. CAN_C3]|uniref:hypothetical protein n=1 Tax=unclassified Cryobacterium TaxID=2649013 RepID=UPI0018CB1012|nr:hypothetical protein [Cryobacterium sp. CAN_C3]MEC5153391.1 hypothetical protein [Cryobacterium sp. CAN_C3]
MSDNTPIDGKKNSETDASTVPDLTNTGQGSTEQTGAPEHAAPESATAKTAPEPAREPLVIDYDAINENLSAAERSDRAEGTEPATTTGSHAALPSERLAEPAPVYAPEPNLADDYAATDGDSRNVGQSPAVATAAEADTAAVAPVPITPVGHAPSDTAPAQQQPPIYVQAPTKPKNRSNRGGGILIALLATAVFAALYAVAAFIIIGVTSTTVAVTMSGFTAFAALPVFYIPIIFFFLAYSALIALVNRGGWWAYVLFGFLVAAVVYFSYIGGALLGLVIDGRADGLSPDELSRIVGSLLLNPGAITAALIAREVPIWAGAWIARRGRRVTAKNLEARTEYERQLAGGPHVTRP